MSFFFFFFFFFSFFTFFRGGSASVASTWRVSAFTVDGSFRLTWREALSTFTVGDSFRLTFFFGGCVSSAVPLGGTALDSAAAPF